MRPWRGKAGDDTGMTVNPGQGTSAPDGLVLAGGRGRRLGGADKGLQPFHGEAVATHALRALGQRCGHVFISANRNLAAYRALGATEVLQDLRPAYPGPLAGLEAVRGALHSDRLLVLPCDMPLVALRILDRLRETLDADPGLDAVFAATDRRDHFLVSALRCRALCSVSACLDQGTHSVRAWLEGLAVRREVFHGEDAATMLNLNTPGDWAAP
jgi:molybdopterin-guanine dinucleotide biosynthesis protein A